MLSPPVLLQGETVPGVTKALVIVVVKPHIRVVWLVVKGLLVKRLERSLKDHVEFTASSTDCTVAFWVDLVLHCSPHVFVETRGLVQHFESEEHVGIKVCHAPLCNCANDADPLLNVAAVKHPDRPAPATVVKSILAARCSVKINEDLQAQVAAPLVHQRNQERQCPGVEVRILVERLRCIPIPVSNRNAQMGNSSALEVLQMTLVYPRVPMPLQQHLPVTCSVWRRAPRVFVDHLHRVVACSGHTIIGSIK
mmetsp:Transcript_69695/g.137017  ORF Transcript_69695/g.137017 Transcript_69695/m.137017 type:complete len:252 (+) Transcript_69695:550-1305(+)